MSLKWIALLMTVGGFMACIGAGAAEDASQRRALRGAKSSFDSGLIVLEVALGVGGLFSAIIGAMLLIAAVFIAI